MVTMTSPTYFSFSQNFSPKLQSPIDIHHYDRQPCGIKTTFKTQDFSYLSKPVIFETLSVFNPGDV